MAEAKPRPADPLKPSPALLSKLGSIIIHFDEYESAGGHPYDLDTARRTLADPEVREWMKAMGPMLPVKRSNR